jgi:hypothetical protein
MFDPHTRQTRRQHSLDTGHAGYETSLTLCLFLGVQKGLHGWLPQESDPVCCAYRCTTCGVLLEDPAEEVAP